MSGDFDGAVPAMTAEEFEHGYAERSGVTVEWLHAAGFFPHRCDCGEELCTGWQMTTASTLAWDEWAHRGGPMPPLDPEMPSGERMAGTP